MHFIPNEQEFLNNDVEGKSQLIYTVIPADLETPVSLLLKVEHISPYHFLLESVQDGEIKDRYSIIGLNPDLMFRCDGEISQIVNFASGNVTSHETENPLDVLQDLIDKSRFELPEGLPPMSAGLFGYMSYDTVRLMENIPCSNPDELHIPDSVFIRPQIIIIFDAVKNEIIIASPIYDNRVGFLSYKYARERIIEVIEAMSKPLPCGYYADSDSNNNPIHFQSNTTRDEYHQMVEKAKEYIIAGDIFQVVPSQRFTGDFPYSPFSLYRSLRNLNPSPYLFYVNMDNFTLVGSSPEILAKVEGTQLTIRPLAGTRKRGKNKAEDDALEKDLLSDPKELAEHLMLVDLGRNDVGRVAKVGTVKLDKKFFVEYYSHVMHIVSNVTGEIRDNISVIDVLKASFPVGTVSGAPKIRAMEIIDELEKVQRSFYAGGVGYFSANGDMDICIALRTGLVKDDKLILQAGGGVVADSDAESEYQETINKAKALMRAAETAVKYKI